MDTLHMSEHFAEQAPLFDADQRLHEAIRSDLDRQALARATSDRNVPFHSRLAVASLLGILGDPRVPALPDLVFIPGGTIDIGLPAVRVAEVSRAWRHVGIEADWIRKEAPVHQVVIGDFRIGAYPVTNLQYKEFLVAADYPVRPSTWYLGAYPWDRSNHPVAGLSADDADSYVAWLRGSTGLPFRLPTESEWEYAAKGPDGLEYPWGDQFDHELTNTRESGIHTTTPVGIYPAGRSPFGIWDMAGNVEEYVADSYQPYPGGELVDDHLVQVLGEYRVTRGGSFARYGDLARTRRRHGGFPSPLYPCGFRVAADVTWS